VLRAVAGLVQPASGRIALDGEAWFDSERGVSRKPDERRVGLVFQEYALFPHMNVRQNIAYGGQGRVDEYLERFRIAHLAKARTTELSGGERQRVALARALAAATRVVTLECSADEQEELALAALPLLEAADDHAGLAEVWASLASGVYNARGHLAQMEHASEQALRHATLAGQHQTSLWMLPLALVHGPRPAGEALAKLDALYPHPWTNLNRAALLAMSNRIEEARTVDGIAEDHLRELGDEGGHAHFLVATVERIAGNYEAAAERLRRAADYAAERGETAFLSTYALLRARTLCALGRYEEAESLARQGRELAHEDDTGTPWRQVAALVRAHHGDHAEAERLAREAVSLMQETDSPWWQGDALSDLGEVLAAAGHHEAAANAFQEALVLYERKQIVPLARRTRERLAALQPLQN